MTSNVKITAEFFTDDPFGIVRLTKAWSTLAVYRVPRSLLDVFCKLPGADFCCTYFLLSRLSRRIYIGHDENMQSHIKCDALSMDFWDEALILSTSDNSLQLADIQNLESIFLAKATSAKSYRVVNTSIPPLDNPSDQLEDVVTFAKYCVNLFGYDFFSASSLSNCSSVQNHQYQIDKNKLNDLLRRSPWSVKHPICKKILSDCDIPSHKYFTLASYHNNGGNHHYWADVSLDFVNHNWTLVLFDREQLQLNVLQIPQKTFSIDSSSGIRLYTRYQAKQGRDVIDLKIGKDYIDRISDVNFKEYLTDSISLTVK